MATVYRFKKYDISSNTYIISPCWGTREGIKKVECVVMEETVTEVDDAYIGVEIEGLTARGFDPHRTEGFQQRVNPYRTTNAAGLFPRS